MSACLAALDVESPTPTTHPADVLAQQAVLISDLIRRTARRGRLPVSEHDDFESLAWSRLVKDDYRVLRQYRGDSSLSTYLTIVLRRVLLDHRTAKWGKWRPSAEARRLGPVAVAVERMVTRDDRPVDEALRRLGVDDAASAELLRAIATMPSRRVRRRAVSEDMLIDRPCQGPAPDAALTARDRRALGKRIHGALSAAMRRLTEEDRALLRSRYAAGQTVANVASDTGIPQKSLYRRFDRLHTMMRSALEHHGIGAALVRDVIGVQDDMVSNLF